VHRDHAGADERVDSARGQIDPRQPGLALMFMARRHCYNDESEVERFVRAVAG